MQRFVRRKDRPRPGRGPARWTAWEVALMLLSVLLIVFPLYAEAYRWFNPLAAPAAPRFQRVTDTPVATVPSGPTNTPTTGASTDTPTAGPPTATTGAGTPSATSAPPTDTPTAGPPTATATAGPPTATGTTGPSPTTAPATSTPTNGPSPTATATLTPLPNEPPLRLDKGASVASAQAGQRFNYTITVFSNKASASTIDVRDTIDSNLEVLGASATNGSCNVSGNLVTCQVSAQNNQPVTISISVQVRAGTAAGQRISNQALAQDDRQFTAASDRVLVDVAGGGQPAPPTNTPGGPTSPPQPTNTPGGPTSPPPPTNTPGGPTSPPQPTNTPKPGGGGGGGGGDGGGGGSTQATPIPPPLPPLPQEGVAVLPPTPRPGRPPATGGTARPTTTAGATSVPIATVQPTPDIGVFFRMASDWGSQFVGQEINYVIAFRNTRTTGAITNLVISSGLPENLEILEAKSDRGDPQLQGNDLTFRLDALQPGESVEIAVRTKVKDGVQVGTRIVSQAEAMFDGLQMPLRSNVVTVLIVGNELGPVAPAVQSGTASPTVVPSATITVTPSPSPAATVTAVPTATPTTVVAATASPAGVSAAPLPATSQGIPISGFALLGLTLLLRTVRIHRAQSRI